MDEATLQTLEIERLLKRIKRLAVSFTSSFEFFKEEIEFMSAEIDRLETEVREMTSAVDSGITLIKGLGARVRAVAGDAVKATALADELDAKARQLSEAVTENTPAA